MPTKKTTQTLEAKKLFDRIEEIEKSNSSIHESCSEMHTRLHETIKLMNEERHIATSENDEAMSELHNINEERTASDKQRDIDMKLYRDQIHQLERRGGKDSNFKEKLIVAGAWGLVAAAFVYGVVKLGKLPVAEPSTIN